VGLVVYPEFSTLDLIGSADIFIGNDYIFDIVTIGENSNGTVGSKRNTLSLNTKLSMEEAIQQEFDILVLPGTGTAISKMLDNSKFISNYKQLCNKSKVVFTTCTGSFILAKTGLIDNIYATTNKAAYSKYTPNYPDVKWIHKARWVHNKKYITSSGTASGIDTAAYILSLVNGNAFSKIYTAAIEYKYNADPDNDPYAA
ncbi:class I glutamine amidotransferase-like protein, partial [Neoconidiobolus thromboides FSU 785]